MGTHFKFRMGKCSYSKYFVLRIIPIRIPTDESTAKLNYIVYTGYLHNNI